MRFSYMYYVCIYGMACTMQQLAQQHAQLLAVLY